MVLYQEYDRLVTLSSVHHAIKAEKLLAKAGIKVIAQPTPREIDVSCGQCLLFKAGNEEKALAVLKQGQVMWSKLFARNALSRVYEEIADAGRGAE